jgi:drug/metabolite transporter (DMT)-like permease
VSSIVICVVAAWAGWPLVPAGLAPTRALLWLVVFGLLWQVIPIFLIMRFVPRTGSGLGTILTSTELPVAVLSSCFFFGEHLRLSQIFGILLVLGGIALPHLPRRATSTYDKAIDGKPGAVPDESGT